MRTIMLRFMLTLARFEQALAVLGGNRHAAAAARRAETHWEAELDAEWINREVL